MMPDDTYLTISGPAQGLYKEKMSKFLSFAEPCATPADAMAVVARYRKEYFDARHVCWAYMLGAARDTFRSNDDGEPSGTAGKPILGAMLSAGLTDVVIVVVRYFGGIELGTSGLARAYRAAAGDAIAAADVREVVVMSQLTIAFDYPLMATVMHMVKEAGAGIVGQDFRESCTLTVSIRRASVAGLRQRLARTFGVRICE